MGTTKSPKYRELCDEIAYGVFANLTVGDKIPPTRELCDRYGMSEITVNRALSLLVKQGLIRRTPGRGTVLVRSPKSGRINFDRPNVTLTVLGIREWLFTDAIERLLVKYRALNPRVTVELTRASEAEYRALIDEGPYDLTLVNTWLMREFVADPAIRRRFLPIYRLGELWFDEQACFENVIRWCKADDELMCLPLTNSAVVGLVNPTYRAASVERFAKERTLEGFLSALKQIRHETAGEQGYPLLLFLAMNRWPIFLRMLGAELFSADGKTCLIDQPKALAAVQMLVDLMYRDRVCIPLPLMDQSAVDVEGAAQLFGTGKFAYTLVTHAEARCSYPFEPEYVLLPEAERSCSHLHIEGVMVGRDLEHTHDVRDFLNFLMTADNQLYLSEHCDGFACPKKTAGAYAALQGRRRKGFDRFLEQMPSAEPVVAAPREKTLKMLADRLYPAWLGIENAESACRAAAKEINSM